MLMIFTLLCLWNAATAAELRIKSTNNFINFLNTLSSSSNHSGTTVLLDTDLDFSGDLSSKISLANRFNGVFDGQGHTISNLIMNTQRGQMVGIFSSSNGLTVKNVVIDPSCYAESSFKTTGNFIYAYVGTVTNECFEKDEECILEGIVNMANVTFKGNITNNTLFMGGLVGRTDSGYAKNCVNYGSVTHSGTIYDTAYIGGIVGYSHDLSIQNCANYGSVAYIGSRKHNIYIGGIAGMNYVTFKGCVSTGKIISNKDISNYIGAISGTSASTVHCYWTNDVGYDPTYWNGAVGNNFVAKFNMTILSELNEYATKNTGWSKWLMLYLNGGNINNINQSSLVVTQKHFPNPVMTGNTFLFWCLDTECNERYDPKTTDITRVTELYAAWSNFILVLVFNFGNGTTEHKSLIFNETIDYPEDPTREGYTFNGWVPKPERMPAKDTTVVVQWAANNYIVTLNVNGGDALPVNEFTVTYDQPYNCLPNASRTGHTFIGWFTDEGTEVTNETTANITADNHTLYAHWTADSYTLTFDYGNGIIDNETLKYNETINYPENLTREDCVFNGWEPKLERMPAEDTTVVVQWTEIAQSEYVEIIFGKKNLDEDDIYAVIRSLSEDKFTIIKLETDKETGEIRVIIRFTDPEKAKDFVRNVNEDKTPEYTIRASIVPNTSFLSFAHAKSRTFIVVETFIAIAIC